jgi:hypothetical protein
MDKIKYVGISALCLIVLYANSCRGQYEKNVINDHITLTYISKHHDKTPGLLEIYPGNSKIKIPQYYYVDTVVYNRLILYIKSYQETFPSSSIRKMEPSCVYCYNIEVHTSDSIYFTYDLINDEETKKYFTGFIKVLNNVDENSELINDIRDRVPILE